MKAGLSVDGYDMVQGGSEQSSSDGDSGDGDSGGGGGGEEKCGGFDQKSISPVIFFFSLNPCISKTIRGTGPMTMQREWVGRRRVNSSD